MGQAKQGDKVQVHYKGTLSDGDEFDNSFGGEPLEFTLGAGEVIPGFDAGVDGMGIGETKTVQIPADKAYGPLMEELFLSVTKDQLPPELELELGQTLVLNQEDGNVIHAVIAEITDAEVLLDANHPLAGQDLTFEIKLEAIV